MSMAALSMSWSIAEFIGEGGRTQLEEVGLRACLSKDVLSSDPSPTLSYSVTLTASSQAHGNGTS